MKTRLSSSKMQGRVSSSSRHRLGGKPSLGNGKPARSQTRRMLIDGQWVESSSTRTLANLNPANTEDLIGTIKQATREETRRAVEVAASALPAGRATRAPARGRMVALAARMMEEQKEELAQILRRE